MIGTKPAYVRRLERGVDVLSGGRLTSTMTGQGKRVRGRALRYARMWAAGDQLPSRGRGRWVRHGLSARTAELQKIAGQIATVVERRKRGAETDLHYHQDSVGKPPDEIMRFDAFDWLLNP